MKNSNNSLSEFLAKIHFGKIISYIVLVIWILITAAPLFWMSYSSFKSNEELTRDIYAWPHDLFDNDDDEYTVIAPALNVVPDYDIKKDTRERLIIESTSISPGRRIMVHFLLKEELPEDIASRQPGDFVYVRELPSSMQFEIGLKTVWFNYRKSIETGGLIIKFFNSILYATVSTFFIILLGLMIGFATSKMGFEKFSAFVIGLIGLGYLLSIHSVIIPLFLLLRNFNLTDTHLGITIVYIAFGLPLSVMLSSQFIRDLPNSLVESAYIDGASVFQAFRRIILPMCKPVIITISIISALGIWNEFILVLVLASSETTKSLPVGVFSFTSLTSNQLGWQMAALVIATLPAMIIYFIFNKRIAQGVVVGAIKE